MEHNIFLKISGIWGFIMFNLIGRDTERLMGSTAALEPNVGLLFLRTHRAIACGYRTIAIGLTRTGAYRVAKATLGIFSLEL